MKKSHIWGAAAAGACAGAVAGLFGAGGGMVLVPLMTALTDIDENALFPTSIAIIVPICLVSLVCTAVHTPLPWQISLPYLLGSAVGGLLAGRFGSRIPAAWLHRGLGILILWGGVRYLC